MMKYLRDETDAIYKAYAAYQKGLEELQANCVHQTLVEANRESMEFFSDLPYIRICEDCGTEEKSHYGSWKVLTGRAYKVNRSEVYSNRPMQTWIPDNVRYKYVG